MAETNASQTQRRKPLRAGSGKDQPLTSRLRQSRRARRSLSNTGEALLNTVMPSLPSPKPYGLKTLNQSPLEKLVPVMQHCDHSSVASLRLMQPETPRITESSGLGNTCCQTIGVTDQAMEMKEPVGGSGMEMEGFKRSRGDRRRKGGGSRIVTMTMTGRKSMNPYSRSRLISTTPNYLKPPHRLSASKKITCATSNRPSVGLFAHEGVPKSPSLYG